MNKTIMLDLEKKGLILVPGGNIFIPISLGNHYYSKKILRRLMDDFVAKSRLSVIFVCDRLRFLSYKIRGVADDEMIKARISVQLDQIISALVEAGVKSHGNAILADWEFIQDDHQHTRLLSRLNELIERSPILQRQVDTYAARMIHSFRGKIENLHYQRQYLIEETALSIYMTEIRGFNVELYRRGMGLVDALYRESSDELMLMLGKSKLDRQFIALEGLL